MTTSHGRRIQGRRALAIMAWASLVTIAGLLWYGQEENMIRIQAWEPAALLLSAYSAFLAIFGWLLFAPQRKSAEESPALFFSGMLTLIPPCFIAYHLMPPSSPLRGWLTIGIFVFGLMSILSPLPAEVFAVPRDRKSYLQPLTDCYLSALDVEEPVLDLQSLVSRRHSTLSVPDVAEPQTTHVGAARDPWTDPFHGTGRAMSEVGSARRSTYSESRTRERTQESDRDHMLPQSRNRQQEPGDGFPALPSNSPPALQLPTSVPAEQATPGLSRPPMTARSAFAPRESRAPNYRPPSTARVIAEPGTTDPPAIPVSKTAERRPLTEPGGKSTQRAVSRELPSRQSPPPLEPLSGSGLGAISAAAPLASAATYDDVLKSAVAEFRPLTDPARHEADRRIRELEADDEQDASAGIPSAGVPAGGTSALNDVKMERHRDEHGVEMIEGTIHVHFEVGQRRAHLHVPFSPPLAEMPEVECEAVSDDSVRCKVAVRQPYGIRIEVRRSDTSSALKTEVGFAAVSTPPPRRSRA